MSEAYVLDLLVNVYIISELIMYHVFSLNDTRIL